MDNKVIGCVSSGRISEVHLIPSGLEGSVVGSTYHGKLVMWEGY